MFSDCCFTFFTHTRMTYAGYVKATPGKIWEATKWPGKIEIFTRCRGRLNYQWVKDKSFTGSVTEGYYFAKKGPILHDMIFLHATSLQQANQSSLTIVVYIRKKCRSILKHVLERCGNRIRNPFCDKFLLSRGGRLSALVTK